MLKEPKEILIISLQVTVVWKDPQKEGIVKDTFETYELELQDRKFQ